MWDPADWWCSAGYPSWFLDQLWLRLLLLRVSDKTLLDQTPVNRIPASVYRYHLSLVSLNKGRKLLMKQLIAESGIFSLQLISPDTPRGERDERLWWGSSSLNQQWWPPLHFQNARRPANKTVEGGHIGSTLHSFDKRKKDHHWCDVHTLIIHCYDASAVNMYKKIVSLGYLC